VKSRPRRLFRSRRRPELGHYTRQWIAEPPALVRAERQRLVERVARGESHCILCGGRSVAVGVWQPSPEIQARIGTKPGRSSYALYTLCRTHGAQHPDDVLPAVERHLIGQIHVERGNPLAN
jgi:hypothetical protein